MKKIVIEDNLEDILTIPEDITRIEISQSIIIRYLLDNKTEGQINIEELRDILSKSLRHSYSQKKYLENVSVDRSELEKLNSSCAV